VPPVTDHTITLDGQPVFFRRAGADPVPALYLHGVPTCSDDWLPFLQRGGGLAPDLPGFGRSGKRGDGDFTPAGYARFVERFLAAVEVERVRLCVHDWGAAGLLWAARQPERVERLVVMDAVPFLPGYRWHPWARVWRTALLGELAMGFTSRRALRLARPRLPREVVDAAAPHFDQGTQRAILRLYRAAPEDALAALGRDLHAVGAPALVVWGERDPYVDPAFARAYADALPNARWSEVAGAGHWPWLQRPEVIDEVVDFLAATRGDRPVR